ncbi:hypothetical protein BAE44_0005060, partial [Dichanthelium oligosanthes]
MSPCFAYAQGVGNYPSGACCSGLRAVVSAAATAADRRAACDCLKAAAARVSGLDATKAAMIPARCAVKLPYTISPSADCSR